MQSGVPLTTEMVLRSLITATENWDERIANASIEIPTWFNFNIGMGTAELGKGYVRTKFKYHNDIIDAGGGLTTWREVQRGRAAGTGYTKFDGTVVPPNQDPGFDPCKYDTADLVEYGFAEEEYHAFEAFMRTNDICINQIKFDWQFVQQMDLIYGSLADYVVQRWENFKREYWMYLAAANSRFVALGGGNPFTYTVAYNPFTSSNLTIATPPAVYSAFSWRPMRSFWNNLALQARSSAMGMINGNPMWTLVIDGDDFEDWLDNDPDAREDMRYARPEVNLQGWGALEVYRKWGLVHMPLMPRYDKTAAGTFERVQPYDSSSVFIGNKRTLSRDYEEAEFAVAFIFHKEAFQCLVPPTPSSAGGGVTVGNQPSWGGEFSLINIKDRTENMLGEKAFYFDRIQCFMEPLRWSELCTCFLYRRCVAAPVRLCEPCASDVGSGAIDVVDGTAANLDDAATSTIFTVELASCLPCEDGDVTITIGQNTYAAHIAESGNAPTYTIIGDAARDWATLLATDGTITCGASAR